MELMAGYYSKGSESQGGCHLLVDARNCVRQFYFLDENYTFTLLYSANYAVEGNQHVVVVVVVTGGGIGGDYKLVP